MYNIGIKAALAVFAVALSACSSDNDVVDNGSNNNETLVSEKTMSFSASMDAGNATRTDFNSNSTIWAAGDKIRILNLATITAPDQDGYPIHGYFSIKEHAGTAYTKEEVFTGSPIRSNGNGADEFYAYYPSTAGALLADLTDGRKIIQVKGELPTVQTAMNGTYDQSLHYMTALSNNSTFSFKNVCALLKITLTNNSSISRVKVIANPKLTRDYDQSFKYPNIVGTFEAGIMYSDGTTNMKATGSKKSYVELRAADDDGTATSVIGNGTFYMVVLPATLDNGFTLTFEKNDGSVIYQRINANVPSFERNKMYELGEYDCSNLESYTGMTALTDVVDLDLPSGTLWATKNIAKGGAFVSSIYDEGDYFSWGKDHFTGATTYGSVPSRTNNTLQSQFDWAYAYNDNYCMPIYAQIYEFYNHFPDANKTSYSGSAVTNKGAEFTAPTGTGRTIWLPYGGHYYSSVLGLRDKGTQGDYWSRTYYGKNGTNDISYCIDLKHSGGIPISNTHSGWDYAAEWVDNVIAGRTIRPVATNIKIAPIY